MIWIAFVVILVGAVVWMQMNKPEGPVANKIEELIVNIPLAETEEPLIELSGVVSFVGEGFSVGRITIWNSGEVSYPTDGSISEAAKEFWEAVIAAFPDIERGPQEYE